MKEDKKYILYSKGLNKYYCNPKDNDNNNDLSHAIRFDFIGDAYKQAIDLNNEVNETNDYYQVFSIN